MNPLCTVLPDLPSSTTDWAERYLFNSAILSDYCHEEELDDMHATFMAAGIPYTVQFRPGTPEPEPCDWADECLSAADRNSFACFQ
jgi:hypothetical protein